MVGDFFSALLLFIFVVNILVLAHEAGHFVVARFFGVSVKEFAIGFPPRLFGVKIGKTFLSINALPFGGFVRMKGENGEEKKDADSFSSKHIAKRLLILLAGVFMNLVMAVGLFATVFMLGLPMAVDDEMREGVSDAHIQIMGVSQDSPAQRAGIAAGDILVSLDGVKYERATDIIAYTRSHSTQALRVIVERKGEKIEREVTPALVEGNPKPILGIEMQRIGIVQFGFIRAVQAAGASTWNTAKQMVLMLGNSFVQNNFSNMSGPVGIAAYSLTAWKVGLATFLSLMAQLSVSLAVLNVLPIPALDGGRALFALVELIRRKALREEIENAIHLGGFALLLLLLLAVSYRDIMQLIAR